MPDIDSSGPERTERVWWGHSRKDASPAVGAVGEAWDSEE